jgi:NAD(P)-dependent dehydrogenase (short-subunit alcohol dehydrogenase family)
MRNPFAFRSSAPEPRGVRGRVTLKPIGEQVVVVMGASSGIGRASALAFAARGAKVVVSARSREGLESLVEEIRAAGGEAIAVPADAAEFAEVKNVADTAAEVFGRIDTWAHVAGTSVVGRFEEITPDEFRRVVDVTLTGHAFGAFAALPYLRRAGGGALVHVSSVEGKFSMPYQSAYSAAKHGVEGLLDSLRLELLAEGAPVSVTSVMPGPVNSPFFDKVRTKTGFRPTVTPPVYHPSAVARAIVHAAEHPVRRVVVGGVALAGVAIQGLSPRLMDAALLRVGFFQDDGEPKRADAPDSLFAPIGGHDTVEGTLDRVSRRTSVASEIQLRPRVRLAIAGAGAGALAVLAARLFARGREAG